MIWGTSLSARAIRVPHAACAGAAARLSEVGLGSPVGVFAAGGQRARELRKSVMTGGVGSGAPGPRSTLQILGLTRGPRRCNSAEPDRSDISFGGNGDDPERGESIDEPSRVPLRVS